MLSAAAFMLVSMLSVPQGAIPDSAAPSSAAWDFHVRPLDARIEQWLTTGGSSSPTFRSLLDELAGTDVIVYLAIAERLPGGVNGQLSFLTSTRTARYLRIDLVAGGHAREMVALLGHELQHAVEIAGAAHVRDSQDMAIYYLHIGEAQSNGTRNESLAARAVGERVSQELTAARPGNRSG